MPEDEFAAGAAEMDSDPVGDVPSVGETADTGPSFPGRCHGGPWDTSDVESRFPKGFLLCHMPERAVWIYDRRDNGDFYVRSDKPELLNDEKRERAAEEAEYDIRVLDPAAVKPAVGVKK